MIIELLNLFRGAYKQKIDLKSYRFIEDIAIRHLGVDNLSQARDRYEGNAYLTNFFVKIFTTIAARKYLGVECDSIFTKAEVKGYKPEITYRLKRFEIVPVKLDSYPIIPIGNYDYIILAYVNIEKREVAILGLMSKECLLEAIDATSVPPTSSKSHLGYLKKFEKLITLEELIIDEKI